MSNTRLTWRPATADDVGRLARFKGSTNSDGFVYDTIVAWNGERFVASSRFAYPRCEVQDVEAGDVEVMRTLLKASHHLLMGSIGPSDGPTSWLETRSRLLDRMRPFLNDGSGT